MEGDFVHLDFIVLLKGRRWPSKIMAIETYINAIYGSEGLYKKTVLSIMTEASRAWAFIDQSDWLAQPFFY
jgi:hypothetical protein